MADQAGRGPDPYHVLGITAGASGADIARAYRQLARGLHARRTLGFWPG